MDQNWACWPIIRQHILHTKGGGGEVKPFKRLNKIEIFYLKKEILNQPSHGLNKQTVVSKLLFMSHDVTENLAYQTWGEKPPSVQCVALKERQLIITCVCANLPNKCSSQNRLII